MSRTPRLLGAVRRTLRGARAGWPSVSLARRGSATASDRAQVAGSATAPPATLVLAALLLAAIVLAVAAAAMDAVTAAPRDCLEPPAARRVAGPDGDRPPPTYTGTCRVALSR